MSTAAAVLAAAVERADGPSTVKGARNTSPRVAVVGLFVLAVLYTLSVARLLILPIVLAVLLSFLLWPIVRGLRRLHIPGPVGALLLLVGLTVSLGYGVYAAGEHRGGACQLRHRPRPRLLAARFARSLPAQVHACAADAPRPPVVE